MKKTLITLASVASLAASVQAQTVILTDNTLSSAIEILHTENNTGVGTTYSYTAQSVGGNTGAFAQFDLSTSWDGNGTFGNQGTYYSIPGLSFDPTALGKAIESITFSADIFGLTSNTGLRYAAFQGSTRLILGDASSNGINFSEAWGKNTFTTTSFNSLDTSATGDVITFGLWVGNGISNPEPRVLTTAVGVDNLSISVAVPEPSSTALIGLAALGLLARRKR